MRQHTKGGQGKGQMKAKRLWWTVRLLFIRGGVNVLNMRGRIIFMPEWEKMFQSRTGEYRFIQN